MRGAGGADDEVISPIAIAIPCVRDRGAKPLAGRPASDAREQVAVAAIEDEDASGIRTRIVGLWRAAQNVAPSVAMNICRGKGAAQLIAGVFAFVRPDQLPCATSPYFNTAAVMIRSWRADCEVAVAVSIDVSERRDRAAEAVTRPADQHMHRMAA